jgi:putative transposase
MPKRLKRYYGYGHLHFLTFSCYRRLPLLGKPDERTEFVRALGKIRQRHGFPLVGYVVMPEHVHLLIGETPRVTPSKVLAALKQVVARELLPRHQSLRSESWPPGPRRNAPALPRFWEPRFHDFNVYSAAKRREKLDYIHANPVKRGLVEDPAAWLWSSYSFYQNGDPGLVSIDLVD